MTEGTDKPTVSMTKPGPAGRPRVARADIPAVKPPRTIDYAGIAIAVLIVALAVRALSLLGSRSQLIAYLINANKTAKKPDKNYTMPEVLRDLHNMRTGTLIQTGVVIAALIVLVVMMRRTRTASGSRWALLIILILTGIPLYIIPTAGYPSVTSAAAVVAGITGIAALILTFLPQSMVYFRQCREALTPPELRGQPRPGLGGLFRPRPPGPVPARTGASRAPAATQPPAAAAQTAPRPAARSKAKVRVDQDAVAKGAQLARSRAKASKSRRTEA